MYLLARKTASARGHCLSLLLILALLWPTAPADALAPLLLVQRAGAWVLQSTGGYLLGKAIDELAGQSFQRQLEAAMPELVERVAAATGEERRWLQAQLNTTREQLGNVEETLALRIEKLDEQRRADARRLHEDQKQLNDRLDTLATRLAEVEGRVRDAEGRLDEFEGRLERVEGDVGDLADRVGRLEDAMQAECLDLRRGRQVGEEGYRVPRDGRLLIQDSYQGGGISLSARLYLDSCTAPLDQRGLLVQLSFLTRGLRDDLDLYATFKHVEAGGFDGSYMNQLSRTRYPLERPSYRLDGQVTEFFFPYQDIPFPSHSNRIALALVLTHDGRPIYSLSDRVISCVFGRRVACRWGP